MSSNNPSYERFGPFSASEVSRAFNLFDLDRNSYVGSNELRHIYHCLGEEVTDEEIDEMIKMVDLDGDGQVNGKEFAQMIFKYAGQKEELKEIKKETFKSPKSGGGKSNNLLQSPTTIGGGEIHSPASAAGEKFVSNEEQNYFGDEPIGLPVFSVAHSRARHAQLREILVQVGFTEDSITELLENHREIEMDVENEELRFDEFLSFFHFPGSNQEELSNEQPQNDEIKKQNSFIQSNYQQLFYFLSEGKELISVRSFLVSLMIYSNFTPEEQIEYSFHIFDRDRAGTLLDEDLLDLLKSVYLASTPLEMKKKGEAILRHTPNPKKGEVSLEELQNVQQRFPALILPSVAD